MTEEVFGIQEIENQTIEIPEGFFNKMTDYEKAIQDISNFIDYFAPSREVNDQLQKELGYICNYRHLDTITNPIWEGEINDYYKQK